MKTGAIIFSDIHGHFNTFKALLDSIPKDILNTHEIIIAGDLLDRGPRQSELVNYIMENKITCIMGNHEEKLTFVENKHINEKQKAFLLSLPWFIKRDEYRKEGKPLVVSHHQYNEGNKEESLWGRGIEHSLNPDIFNVFGHTPTKEPIITENLACIDTGCFITHKPGFAKLTALVFPEMLIFDQKNIG